MASLGFCRLLARTPCLLSSLNFCKFNVLYYNVLNGIILYAREHIKSLFGDTERAFRDTEWPFRVAECPFRVTE